MIENQSGGTYQAVRIGDPSDWRLVCVISERGMEAYLRNMEDPTAEVACLVKEEWNPGDGDLLQKIESTVYDHPQLLDDFTADIALTAPRSLWVPRRILEEWDDLGDSYYTRIYESDPEDIMRDWDEDKVCLYTLTRGLPAFLQRTFPGAKIRNHQSVLVERFGSRVSDLPRVFIDLREGEADFVLLDGKQLLQAVSHEWGTLEDAEYHFYNLLDVYGFDPKKLEVSLSGLRDEKRELMQRLRERVAYVMMTMVPAVASKAGMSLTASLLMRSK